MENQNHKEQMQNSRNIWEICEVEKLSIALAIAYKTQTTYNEALDLKDRILGWRLVLEEDFNITQVLFALKEFMKKSDNMPVPANIFRILSPQEHLISESEYVQACKWQEKNGYPMFSDAKSIKDAYKNQNKVKREDIVSRNNQVKNLIGSTAKLLTGGK